VTGALAYLAIRAAFPEAPASEVTVPQAQPAHLHAA
jgi:hypothetical protein